MYSVFRNLAIIILSAKFFGLVARKFKAPQVVGEIIAGLIIGPCLLNLVHISDTISIFAEIGVVLLMFSTGLWAWRCRWQGARSFIVCSTASRRWAARSSTAPSSSVPL